MAYVIPLHGEQFTAQELYNAWTVVKGNIAAVTDRQLSIIACYQPDEANQLMVKRDAAVARQTPPPAPSGISKPTLEAIITGIAGPLKKALAERDARIAKLENQVSTLRDELVALQAHYALSETD